MGLPRLLASPERRPSRVSHVYRTQPYIPANSTLLSFAAGKPSALVIDIGSSSTSITPVHDGLILRKGVTRTPLAGDFISSQLRLLFSTSQPPIPLNPHYIVASKTAVDAGSPALATYRSFSPATEPHPSFRRLQEDRVLLEFKESVVQVWPGPGRLLSTGAPNGGLPNEELARQGPGRPFEFPDGFNQVFAEQRYRATEGLFDVKAALTSADSPHQPETKHALPQAVHHALQQVDVDVRANLLMNVVVTGAASLTQGLVERLSGELQTMYAGPKVRISAPGNLYERRFGAWIGGSILASLGTFHQVRGLWRLFLFSSFPPLSLNSFVLKLFFVPPQSRGVFTCSNTWISSLVDVDLQKGIRGARTWDRGEEVQVVGRQKWLVDGWMRGWDLKIA